MTAVFDPDYVKRLHGDARQGGRAKMDLAEQLMEDIETFKKRARRRRAR